MGVDPLRLPRDSSNEPTSQHLRLSQSPRRRSRRSREDSEKLHMSSSRKPRELSETYHKRHEPSYRKSSLSRSPPQHHVRRPNKEERCFHSPSSSPSRQKKSRSIQRSPIRQQAHKHDLRYQQHHRKRHSYSPSSKKEYQKDRSHSSERYKRKLDERHFRTSNKKPRTEHENRKFNGGSLEEQKRSIDHSSKNSRSKASDTHSNELKEFKKDFRQERVNQELTQDKELEEYMKKKVTRITPEIIGRTGGIYIPPHKLAQLQKLETDKSSVEYQRQSWEALRKSINGLVNKVNVGNITNLVQELFRENLVRGRGLLARAILRAQMASPGFTHIYAALLAIINCKLPELGDLVLRRLLLQFRRAYRRNDKIVCKACVKFMAHLVNQRVAHELLALQLAALLLEKLTDDSVEICVEFMQEVGQVLRDISPQGFQAISERFHAILQEGEVDKRVQYTIEKLYETIRKKFADFPGIVPELDLVEEEDQITHEPDLLDAETKGEELLNIFKAEEPEAFLKNEETWSKLSKEILGEDEVNEEDGSGSDTSEDSEADEEPLTLNTNGQTIQIKDLTEQDIINLRKTVYLTFQSSATFEECVHKILKMNIKEGCEIEVCTMLIDSNAMERTFQRFFALQAERLCQLKPIYVECFLECLKRQYQTIHRLETNKLRNTAKFFAHLLYTDALPWQALELFVITEESTTSASRIFIKIIFQELAEHMGLKKLNEILHEPALAPFTQGIFPSDHPAHIRFSINFFTAIGLGGLTEPLREILGHIQQRIAAQEKMASSSEDSSDTSSDSD